MYKKVFLLTGGGTFGGVEEQPPSVYERGGSSGGSLEDELGPPGDVGSRIIDSLAGFGGSLGGAFSYGDGT